MPRKPPFETAEERAERLKAKALRSMDDAQRAEYALDAMVKRSIELYGP